MMMSLRNHYNNLQLLTFYNFRLCKIWAQGRWVGGLNSCYGISWVDRQKDKDVTQNGPTEDHLTPPDLLYIDLSIL